MRAVIYRPYGGPGVLELSRLVGTGRLTTRITAAFDLADAAEAHRPAARGQAVGQIIRTSR